MQFACMYNVCVCSCIRTYVILYMHICQHVYIRYLTTTTCIGWWICRHLGFCVYCDSYPNETRSFDLWSFSPYHRLLNHSALIPLTSGRTTTQSLFTVCSVLMLLH